MRTYRPSDEVDFVVVGSGAAGGVMAYELARIGFSVVVLEQGPWLTERDFSHDPLDFRYRPEKRLTNTAQQPQTRRPNENSTAMKGEYINYGRVVGGGTVHYTGNYWRCPEIEFERALVWACQTDRALRTGPSHTRSSSRTTRKWIGRSEFPVWRAIRSSRRAAGDIPARRFRSSPRACCASVARGSSAGTPGRRRWRFFPAPTGGAPVALHVVPVAHTDARCAPSRAPWSP